MDWRFIECRTSNETSFEVRLAITEDDHRAVDTLWRAIYGTECGWLTTNAPSLITDRFHPHSTYLVARVNGQAVGTMRVVADSPEGLPIEQFVGIDKVRGDGDRRLVEVQRLMILPEQRNRRYTQMPFGVLAVLVKGCLHWCIRNGVSHIVADLFLNTPTTPMGPLLALGFAETGLEFVDTELAEPDRSVALLLEVGELFSRSFRCEKEFYRYLMDHDPIIDVYG